jgi:cyclopropane fatty-acyl-phospholipid synthase-like methyltransferase
MAKAEEMPADVPAHVYSREYFLKCRQGSDEFAASGGARLSVLHQRLLQWAELGPDRRILDVGCGCGELVIHSVLAGAEAVGVDYSSDAIDLAQDAAERTGATQARFHLGDVASLPEGRFNAVILSDVVEHLYQGKLDKLYNDLRERITPDGKLIIHTWPNRWHTEFGYPVARFILLFAGIKQPRSPRKPHDEIMHVNEQSVLSLRRDLLRAGYQPRVWIEHPLPPGTGFMYRATHSWPLARHFFADDLFAIAKVDQSKSWPG